ncbi:hypothetical protein [uncultured Victivallis sp.]|uniref:hypothetical protein n=1 Tax=uncultured Victivallis sp. TaxID=354118 RepID=UPI0025DB49AA|nr:hypothetical protein [uncultured Victivallis sp.]
MANEIRINKQFSGTGHAGEANLYPRGVNTFRQTMATPSPVATALLGAAAPLERTGRAIDQLAGHLAQIQRETDDYNDELALLKMKNAWREQLANMGEIRNSSELDESSARLREEFSQQIRENENLSDRGRRSAEILLETALGGYREKGILQIRENAKREYLAYGEQQFDKAVEMGDVETTAKWYDDLAARGVFRKFPKEDYLSRAAANGYFNSPAIQKLGISALEKEIASFDERDDKGRSKQFPLIQRRDADRLREKLRARRAELINQGADRLAELTASGKLDARTVEELFLDGTISANQYNASLRSLADAEERSRRAAKQQEAEARQATQARRKAEYDKLALELFNVEPYGMPDQQKRQRADWEERLAASDLDDVQRLNLHERLKKKFQGDSNPFSTPAGRLVKKHLDTLLKEQKLYYDPSGLFNREDSEEFQAARYVELVDYAEDALRRGDSVDVVLENVKKQQEQLNDGKVRQILTPQASTMPPDAVRLLRDKNNGRIIYQLRNGGYRYAD